MRGAGIPGVIASTKSPALFTYLTAVGAPVVAEALLVFGPWGGRPSPAAVATMALLVAGTVAVGLLRPARAWILAPAIGLACAVIVLSGSAQGALVAAVLVGAAYGLGSAIVRSVAPAAAPSDRALYAAPIGLGITSYAMLALGLVGALVPLAALGVLVGALLIGRRELWTAWSATRSALARPPQGPAGPLLFAATVWGLVVLVQALAPETRYDALSYHLGLPRVWIGAGRMVDVPEQIQSHYYLGAEMNFTLAMLLGGQVAAKLTSLAYLVLATGAVYALARWCFSASTAGVAAVVFGTTPAIAWQGSTTYVDVAVGLYVTLGTLAALSARRDGSTRLVILSGALAGLAVATKLTALLAVVPLAGLVIIAMGGSRAWLRRGLAFGGAASLAVAPWPILRWVQTGNPVFPLLNGLFRSPLWPPVNTRFALGEFGVGTDLTGLAQLPFALTYIGQRFDEVAFGAAFGVGLVLLPAAVVLHRRSPEARALAWLSIATFGAWAVTAQYARYLLPLVGTLSVLVAAAFGSLSRSGARLVRVTAASLPAVLVVSSLPLLLFMHPRSSDDIPYGVALGIESRDHYLTRTLPTYGALQTLTGLGQAGLESSVLIASYRVGAGDDEDRLYAPGRVLTNSWPETERLFAFTDADSAVAWLTANGVTHLLVDRQGISGAMRDAAVLRPAFLARFGTRIYLRDPVELYRLRIP